MSGFDVSDVKTDKKGVKRHYHVAMGSLREVQAALEITLRTPDSLRIGGFDSTRRVLMNFDIGPVYLPLIIELTTNAFE